MIVQSMSASSLTRRKWEPCTTSMTTVEAVGSMMEISCERETGFRAWESIRSTTVSRMTTSSAYRSSSVTMTHKFLCGSTEESEAHAVRGACRLKIIFVQSSTHGH